MTKNANESSVVINLVKKKLTSKLLKLHLIFIAWMEFISKPDKYNNFDENYQNSEESDSSNLGITDNDYYSNKFLFTIKEFSTITDKKINKINSEAI